MPPVPAPETAAPHDRFERFHAIPWWDQARLARARILVVGAGALGNEVIKNFALLGIGHLAIVDRDRVEHSNLSRAVLFRESDVGAFKADCAARQARAIHPGLTATPLVGNVLADVGLGYFRWAEVVVGALDNREARVFLNAVCAQVRRPWFDGGIEVLQGIVRGFAPPDTACYECTMNDADWQLLNQRRSCSLLTRQIEAAAGAPTTPTTAAVIGAIQAQEAIKALHGLPALRGRGFFFEGEHHRSYTVDYPIKPGCPWHEPPAPVISLATLSSATTLGELWSAAAAELGTVDALDFSRELCRSLTCPACGESITVLLPPAKISAEQLRCPACGTERSPGFIHSFDRASDLLNLTIHQAGLPPWEIIWARNRDRCVGLEISGDDPFRGVPGDVT